MTVSRSSFPETPRALAQATASSAIARTFGESPWARLAKTAGVATARVARVVTAGVATGVGVETAAAAADGAATVLDAAGAAVTRMATIRVRTSARRTAGVRDLWSITGAWPLLRSAIRDRRL